MEYYPRRSNTAMIAPGTLNHNLLLAPVERKVALTKGSSIPSVSSATSHSSSLSVNSQEEEQSKYEYVASMKMTTGTFTALAPMRHNGSRSLSSYKNDNALFQLACLDDSQNIMDKSDFAPALPETKSNSTSANLISQPRQPQAVHQGIYHKSSTAHFKNQHMLEEEESDSDQGGIIQPESIQMSVLQNSPEVDRSLQNCLNQLPIRQAELALFPEPRRKSRQKKAATPEVEPGHLWLLGLLFSELLGSLLVSGFRILFRREGTDQLPDIYSGVIIDCVALIIATGLLVKFSSHKNPTFLGLVAIIFFLRSFAWSLAAQGLKVEANQFERLYIFMMNGGRAACAWITTLNFVELKMKLALSVAFFILSLALLGMALDATDLLEIAVKEYVLELGLALMTLVAFEISVLSLSDCRKEPAAQSSPEEDLNVLLGEASNILKTQKLGIAMKLEQADLDSFLCNPSALRLLQESNAQSRPNGFNIEFGSHSQLDNLNELCSKPAFQLYRGDEGVLPLPRKAFSLLDLFYLSDKILEESVFLVDLRADDSESYPEGKQQFIRITKGIIDTNGLEFLEFTDLTQEFISSQGEQKLLSLINATVSHEMRTPINSINSQNLEMRNIIKKLEDLLTNDSAASPSTYKFRLTRLHKQLAYSNRIHFCSSKFLTFEINDMLDYSQLKQGKFRKNVTIFNLREAVQEIYAVHQYKADKLGIKIKVKFDGFLRKEDGFDFRVCTDEQRLQQVLMNLVSNALKFTPEGGFIYIFCKLLPPNAKVSSSPFGKIQISVQDTGVGIGKEDQKKLFKLFGFLDSTKELNTKGIGLGLHICQMIATFFGGSMKCQSEINEGAQFTFDFNLEDPSDVCPNQTSGRCKNPHTKQYPQFKLSKVKQPAGTPIRQPPKSKRKSIFIQRYSLLEDVPLERQESCLKSQGQLETLNVLDCSLVSPYREDLSQSMENISLKSRTRHERSWTLAKKIKQQTADGISANSADKMGLRKINSQVFDKVIRQKVIPKRILVVDDEPFNLAALKILLTQSGIKGILHSVDFAKNGLEALRLVKKGAKRRKFEKGENSSHSSNASWMEHLDTDGYMYGLILMDCSMPIMDGYEATEEIRETYQHYKLPQPLIVACTGHCEEQFIEKAWRHGMDELVPKPLKKEVIAQILHEVIQQ